MIEKYADLADEVKVLISNPKSQKSVRKTKNGTVITPEMSKAILDIFVKRYGLGNKVKVEISEEPSPVRAAYDYVEKVLKDAIVYMGSSKKDDDWKRFAAAPEYFKDRTDIEIVDPKEAAVEPLEGKNGVPFSATQIRDNIDDKDLIRQMMPSKLTQKDVDKIIKILSGDSVNESLEDYSSEFLKQNIDMNKSRISYLGNMFRPFVFFGPEDSLCEINMVSKDGKDKIDAVYADGKWSVRFNGKKVKENSRGYKTLLNADDFKKLEKKLFEKWTEMKRYPKRMLKSAKKAFTNFEGQKLSDEELKAMCDERIAFLKEHFRGV